MTQATATPHAHPDLPPTGSPDRIAALLETIGPDRMDRAGPLLDRLSVPGGVVADDPVWVDFARQLSRGLLDDFNVSRVHLQEMIRRRMADQEMLRSAGQIYQALSRRPLSDCASLKAGLQAAGIPAQAEEFASQFLFQIFATEINRRLQLLYQVYLAANPFAPDSTEAERIEHLQPMERAANALIDATEPERLLRWLGMAADRDGVDGLLMTLNKYFFDPYRINFRFTYHCNIQCAHCYNFSGPDMKGNRINTEAMLDVVRAMPETGMRNMNITGGEPFMYLDTVLALVRTARDVGVPIISTYTNGFFAKSEENCRKVLGQLKDAGFMNGVGREMDHIKVSAGVFHQEFLDFGIIITLIRVYREMFGKNIVVDYEVLEKSPERQAEIEALLRDKGVRDMVDISFRGVAPIGRGAQFEAQLTHQPVEDFLACSFVDEIVFDPDGSVRPCCGMNYDNEGIVVGNVHEIGLKTILMGLENNAILQYIGANPIGRIFDHLDKQPAPNGYANICNVCGDAVGEMKETEALKRRLSDFQDFFPFWFSTANRPAA